MLASFRQGLGAADYVENKNAATEYRFADGQYDRNTAPALDLYSGKLLSPYSGGNDSASQVPRPCGRI